MGKVLYRCLTAVCLAGWMLVIFWFSAQPATESSEMSGSISYRVIRVCDETFNMGLTEDERIEWAERIDMPIRKGAHMAEYAVMGILMALFLLGYRQIEGRTYVLAFAGSVCYAASDEIHQLFVTGRAGRVSDVCIDAVGATIGLIMLSILVKALRKRSASIKIEKNK